MDNKTDVLLVDGHSLILAGIGSIVEKIPEINKVYTASSGAEAERLIASRLFDVFMLDVELPDANGFDLIKSIRAKDKNVRIIVNTMHEQAWMINKLIKCQVDAIILKSSESYVVEKAVRAVLNDRPYTCPRFEHIGRRLRNGSNTELSADDPTKRELEVLKAISKGNSTTEIAKLLGISVNTVETYRKQLFLKFGAKNVIELTMKAIAKGWITVEN